MATRLALVLPVLALFSACSFSLDRSHSNVTINVSGPSTPLELFPGASMFSVTPPSSSSLFDCLVVNVVGPTITPSVGPNDQLEFLPGLYSGSSCTYPGVSAILPITGQSKVTLKVPSGPKRVVQVGGVVEGSSTMCSNTSIQPVANGAGLAFFELGRTVVDLFRDAAVQVEETWNQTSAAQQAARLMTCISAAGGAAYLSLIQGTPGILSFWPLVEQTGSVGADIRFGVNAGALGNMTLSSYTAVSDGPPGIGFPAINAGSGGISANAGASFGTGDFSVEFWVRYSGPCLFAGDGAMFVMRHSGSALVRFKCNASNGVLFEVEDNSGPVATTTNNNHQLNDGFWHHVAGVKQGNSVYLYVDAGTPTTGSTTFVNNFNFTLSPLTQIGQDTVYTTYQTADYAMVAIYTQPLTMAQVTDHMLAGN